MSLVMVQTSDCIVSPNLELPFDLILDILSRLSVKTLHRFKSVCKTWCTLIQSPTFIQKHLIASNNNNSISLFVIDSRTSSMWLHYMDKTENHNPHRKFSFEMYPRIAGICDGLVCTIQRYPHGNFDSFICNPSTGRARKTSRSILPEIRSGSSFFGFAFKDNDYKLFRIVYFTSDSKVVVRAEVYSMSTDIWSEIKVKKQLIGTIKSGFFSISQAVAVNGVFYWMVYASYVPCLVSFDMNEYVFDMISCPGEFNRVDIVERKLVDLKGEVALAYCRYDKCFDLWVLNEKERSWTMKLRTEDLPLHDRTLQSLGFDRNNNLVMQQLSPDSRMKKLFSYDMESHEIMYLPFVGINELHAVYMYNESLLSV